MLQEVHKGDCPRELMRIIPREITKEKPQSGSWFSSGAKSPDSSAVRTSGVSSPVPSTGKPATPVPSAANSTALAAANAAPNMTYNAGMNSVPSHPDLQKANANDTAAQVSAHSNNTSSTFALAVADSTPLSPKGDGSDTFSEASYSSELEMEKYLQVSFNAAGITTNYHLESEEFLRSLPPIKPINLENYASIPLLPPRPAKSQEKKQKAVAVPKAMQESKSQRESKENALNSAENISTGSFDSPIKFLENYSALSTPFSARISEFSSPESKINTPPHELTSSQFKSSLDQNFGFSTPNQSMFFRSPPSEGDSPAVISFNKKHFDEVLREKARLQGQLEVLTAEAQTVLQVGF